MSNNDALRHAAQQALEALEWYAECSTVVEPAAAAMTTLRAALAEPDWQDLYLKEKKRADMWRDKYESVAGAEQRIYPLAEPVQEPVALNDGRLWQYPDGSIGVGSAPHPRKPLTDEAIVAMWHQPVLALSALELARDIERAHGIKE